MPSKHTPVPHEDLISWLKYFDVEYLDEESFTKLSMLDPNNPSHFSMAVEIAVLPEFSELNDISKQSLRQVLQAAMAASESELEQIFARVGMPFSSAPRSHVAMLKLLWSEVFDETV